jgi:hypothetical protein
MQYTDAPKKFTVDLRRSSPRARKYRNMRGSMTSIDVNETHFALNLQHYSGSRIVNEQTVRLVESEVKDMMLELGTTHNIWHIPADDIIRVLKQWGRI